MSVVLASIVTTLIRLAVGVAALAGFLWLVVRLIARMTGSEPRSPAGREPTDRIDDEDRKIW